MKEDFSNNELEERLRKAAEQFTLSPSDKVWEGINNRLHPRRRRRLWLWAAAIFIALSLGTYFVLHQERGNIENVAPVTTSDKRPVEKNREVPAHKSETESSGMGIQTPVVTTSDQSAGMVEKGNSHQRKIKSQYNNSKAATTIPVPPGHIPSENNMVIQNRQLPILASLHSTLYISDVVQVEMAKIPASLITSKAEATPFNPSGVNTDTPSLSPEEQGKGKRKHRSITYETFFTSGIGYRILNVNPTDYSRGQMAMPGNQQAASSVRPLAVVPQKKKMVQRPDWSYSAGISMAFPLGDHYSFKTGISVTHLGYRIRAYGTNPAYVRNNGSSTISNYADANSFYSQNMAAAPVQKPRYIHNRYLFGEIPALVTRTFGPPEKLHFRIGLGAGLLYMIRSSPVTYLPESGRYFTDKDLLRPLNGNFHLEGDMIIPLSKKLNFTIGPSLQYQILSSYKDYPQAAEHPYFPGIKAGLQWKK